MVINESHHYEHGISYNKRDYRKRERVTQSGGNVYIEYAKQRTRYVGERHVVLTFCLRSSISFLVMRVPRMASQ